MTSTASPTQDLTALRRKKRQKESPYASRPADGLLCEVLLREYTAAADRQQTFANPLLPPSERISQAYFDGTLFIAPDIRADDYSDCSSEPAERTLNKYMAFYRDVLIEEIKQRISELVESTGDLGYTGVIADWGDEREKNVYNNNFMVGPIPCNMEVFISLAYGFRLEGNASFSPGSLLREMMQNAPDEHIDETGGELVSLGLIARPYAAVRAGLFVGVGFDVGFAAAKAGIDGIVSLAEISVPGEARLGLHVTSMLDDRHFDADLARFSNRPDGSLQYAFRPRKYQFSMIYGAGMELAFTDILAGSIGLRLKLQFAFFSKTWRKEIARWNGLCPLDAGRQPWCNVPLVSLNGRREFGDGLLMNWGTTKMPTPFLLFNPLNESTVDESMTTMDQLDRSRVTFGWNPQCEIPID